MTAQECQLGPPQKTGKSATKPKLLVVDDQADVREALRLLLKSAGYITETCASPKEALAAAAYRDHDLIIMDMNFRSDTTSGGEGLRLLEQLRNEDEHVRVIAMTGWSTIELAVEAMRHGACDFIPKPWDNRHFLSVIQRHLHSAPEKEKPLDAELAIARKVQRKLLPEPRFFAMGLECECASVTASDIGGDLYDFFEAGTETLSLLLGDISGKGIGAALLVANLQATIRAQRELATDPAKLIQRVNSLFFDATRPEHFATLFYGSYESRSHCLRYVNCGHPAPVLLRNSGELEVLQATATILGAFQNRDFEERTIHLQPGDRLVLFSDGFSECSQAGDNTDWAIDAVRSMRDLGGNLTAGELIALALSDERPLDDITVLTIRVRD